MSSAPLGMSQHGYSLVELLVALALCSIISLWSINLIIDARLKLEQQQNLAQLYHLVSAGTDLIQTHLEHASNQADHIALDSDIALINSADQHIYSDALLITYHAQNGTRDCTGKKMTADGTLIERYFLRKDSQRSQKQHTVFALACSARFIDQTNPNNLPTTQGASQILLTHIDQWQVQLLLWQHATLRYVDMNEFQLLPEPKPQIVAFKVNILFRSAQAMRHANTQKIAHFYPQIDIDAKRKKHRFVAISQHIRLRSELNAGQPNAE